MIHWITADWPTPANIHAITTLRTGGISQSEFSSLNPADHVGDNLQHVLANRQRIKDMLQLPANPVWLQQTHSVKVVCAEQVTTSSEADASYSDKKNTVCCVLTADCLPVLLYDQQGAAIAAIHGGWRGLLNGIIENTASFIYQFTLSHECNSFRHCYVLKKLKLFNSCDGSNLKKCQLLLG